MIPNFPSTPAQEPQPSFNPATPSSGPNSVDSLWWLQLQQLKSQFEEMKGAKQHNFSDFFCSLRPGYQKGIPLLAFQKSNGTGVGAFESLLLQG